MRKLYYSDGSPYARKVRIVLAEKQIAYEHDRQDIVRPIDTVRGINPNLAIPVFDDGDLRLFDSKVIVEYLIEAYPDAKVAGSDRPFYNGLTRRERHWDDRKVQTTLETLTETIVNIRMLQLSGAAPSTVEYLRRQMTRIDTILDWLDERASADGFIPGNFSILDIELLCAVGYAESRRVAEWRGRSRLEALVDGLAARTSVAQTAPGTPPSILAASALSTASRGPT